MRALPWIILAAIVMVLAALLFPMYYREKPTPQAMTDATQIAMAISAYKMEYGHLPVKRG